MRQAGAEYFLLHRGAQLVQRNLQDKEHHCLTNEFTQRVELVSNMMENVWQDSNFQRDEQSVCLFHAYDVQKNPFFPLVVLLSSGLGVIFVLTQVHFSVLARIQTQHSQTRLHQEDSWCVRRCRSRVTDADRPTSAGRCGRTDAISSSCAQRSRHS